MKLFAVGVSDPNPENWKSWDEPELYSAETKEQAVKMAGYHEDYPAVEVDMSKPGLILKAPPYDDDL